MYKKDDVDGHTALMPTVPPNFNYKQKVRNDVYIFFSFKREFLTTIQSHFENLALKELNENRM